MAFRFRLLLAAGLLAAAAGLFIAGRLASPQQRQARAAGASLLPIGAGIEITGVDILGRGAGELRLRARDGGWQAQNGGRSFPASADRVLSLVSLASGLRRGALVTRDPARSAELGLGGREERLLVLHLAGRPELALEVGGRAPSGEEDYVRVRGEAAVHLVRGNLSVLLAQDRTYWYDLRVLPAEVQAQTMARITVRGSVDLGPAGVLKGGYTLLREGAERGGGWSMPGEGRPVDGIAVSALAGSLASLEGEDFLQAEPASAPAGGRLEIEVATMAGKAYQLRVRPGTGPGLALVSTSWSPWTYVLRAELLRRVVRPAAELLASR